MSIKRIFFQANSLLVAVSVCLLQFSIVRATPVPVPSLHPIAQAPDPGALQPIDVAVVLDDSGSMATCWPWPKQGPPFAPPCRGLSKNPPSDPDALRYSAARLLLQLADDIDRVAMVRFDNLAAGIGELGTLQAVGVGENRRRLIESLIPPDDYFRRGYTRIDLGLQSAIDLLQAVREPGRNQYLLLLTDGEPSQPGNVADQRERIKQQLVELKAAGVFIFPVVLCNPTAGCSGEFLREAFAEEGVREAATAQELVRVFSEIFAEMKPDRSVLKGRNAKGALQFTTRTPHGVRKITYITPRGGLLNVQREGDPIAAQSALSDASIDVNVIEGEALTVPGRWSAETSDFSGFAVVQTDSYPQMFNPSPSIANSPAAVRYYPAGKSLLLLAQSGGPSAGEALLYNGKTPLTAFGQSNLKMLLLKDDPKEVRLQVGVDKEPLQLLRSFRLEARRDLPKLEIFSPKGGDPGLLPNGHASLQAGFSSSAGVNNLAGTVFVTDESKDAQGGGRLIYQAQLTCLDRRCSDENFTPADGRSYKITYIVQAQKDGLRFSDWGESQLSLKPAVAISGLPEALDLAQMPPGGWPIEVSSGTAEEIGKLTAVLQLQRSDDGEAATGAQLDFAAEVPENNVATAALQVTGLETLRPGVYTGQITLQVSDPSGRVMNVDIRPMSTIPVTFGVARPVARIDSQGVDFGQVMFDTSSEFRLDQQVLLPLAYEVKPFELTVAQANNSCPDVTVIKEKTRDQNGQQVLPLRLRSRGPVQPGECSGLLTIRGPNSVDYDIFPQQLKWQVRVADIEWSLVSTALNLTQLQDAGSQADGTLMVRFSGKTPFVLQMQAIKLTGRDGENEVTLTSADLEMPPVEVQGPPTEAGLYEVPMTLVARRRLPFDPMRGSFYNGELKVGVVGLDHASQGVGISFHSPGLAQRYFLPYVLPVYSMPWLVCTGPLTAFILLVLMARIRGRGIDDEELEEAAIATVMGTQALPAAAEPAGNLFADASTPEAAWGSGEWVTEPPAVAPNKGTYVPQPAAEGDPWRSTW